MSDLTMTHRERPVLAYRVDADHFCVRCGVPEAMYGKRDAEVLSVTDEDDLYDVDSSGDPPEYRARWERCATCGESLDPRPMRLPWVK